MRGEIILIPLMRKGFNMKKVQLVIICEFFLFGIIGLYKYGRFEYGIYSVSKTILLVLPFILSIFIFIFTMKYPDFLETFINKNGHQIAFPALLLMLLAAIGFISPHDFWGNNYGYFEKTKIFVAILSTIPAQLLFPTIIGEINLRAWRFFRLIMWIFFVLFFLGGLIWISGLGITPEPWFWNGDRKSTRLNSSH